MNYHSSTIMRPKRSRPSLMITTFHKSRPVGNGPSRPRNRVRKMPKSHYYSIWILKIAPPPPTTIIIMKRPNLVLIKAKTTGTHSDLTTSTAQQQRKKNFFGFGKDNPSSSGDYFGGHHNSHDGVVYERTLIDMTPIAIGNKTITIWPYDDYHLTQKLYYESILHPRTPKSPAAAAALEPATPAPTTQPSLHHQSSIPIFSRPADPPDIPTEVQGLSLKKRRKNGPLRSFLPGSLMLVSLMSYWRTGV
jgi:hypothetical protein